MSAIWQNFWRDEAGLILSAELVMILTIGVLGLVVGLVNVQNALLGEFNDLGSAFRSLNQSYGTPTFRGCWKGCALTSYTLGSCFVDIYEPGCIQAENSLNGAVGCYGLELNCANGGCLPATSNGACSSTTGPGLTPPLKDSLGNSANTTVDTEHVLSPKSQEPAPGVKP